jgi:hypothetical protein
VQIERNGSAYPAALDSEHDEDPASILVVEPGSVVVDTALRQAGEAHLAAVRAATPGIFDGTVLALDRVEAGRVYAHRGSYFDMVATCDALVGNDAMRARAEELAGGDPLHSGAGRTAAVGATLVVVRGSLFTIGRRSDDVALDPGRWHVVPSGTIDGRGLRGTIADELRAEHGGGASDLRVIGLGYDLSRLRPELTLLAVGSGTRPEPSAEFAEIRDVELTAQAITALWKELGPGDLTPAAALALAALERHLSSSGMTSTLS